MSELLDIITGEIKLSPTNVIQPVWEWHSSVEKGVVTVGHLKEYGAGYLPVIATIRVQEEDFYAQQASYSLVLNYNGGGCSKTLRPDRVKVAATRGDVEDWAIDTGDEPASKDYIDERMELIERQIEDGSMMETRDEAVEYLQSYAEDGEWYEKMSDYDKM